MNRKITGLLVAAVVVASAGYWAMRPNAKKLAHVVDVKVPELSARAVSGGKLFDQHCAVCHGKYAAGGETGPPLVHIIYEPNHHADAAFYLAARNGVRRHHWRFGNMPPLPDVKESDVTKIITYVRALQRANGIR